MILRMRAKTPSEKSAKAPAQSFDIRNKANESSLRKEDTSNESTGEKSEPKKKEHPVVDLDGLSKRQELQILRGKHPYIDLRNRFSKEQALKKSIRRKR